MEDNAFWLVQCHGNLSKTDGSGFESITNKYGNLVMCYVDDVVIATPTLTDHIDTLNEVLDCMKTAGLKCKPSKSEILRESMKYLGRMVDRHGVKPDPDAVKAVLKRKAPG